MKHLLSILFLAMYPSLLLSQNIKEINEKKENVPDGKVPPVVTIGKNGEREEEPIKQASPSPDTTAPAPTTNKPNRDTLKPKRDHDFFILPESVTGEPGEWIIIVPDKNEAEKVKWKLSKGLKKIPHEKLFPDTKFNGIIVSGRAGTYEVWGWGAKAGEPSDISVCKVYIGVEPGPDPVPPGPDPVPPPVPTDPLGRAIYDALQKEQAVDKVGSTQALADLYTAASVQVKESKLTTVKEYHDLLKSTRINTIGEKIPLVRAVITQHLNKVLPTKVDALLNDTNRNLCSQAFTEVAYALRACCP